MTEFLKQVFAQIPLFLSSFARAFGQPRAFGSEIEGETGKSTRTTRMNDAVLFLGICLCITAISKSAVFGSAGVTALYIAKDALWKVFLIMAVAGLMWLSWRLVGGGAKYDKYVAANCYYFGILSVLVHLVLVVGKRAFGTITGLSSVTFVIFYACTVGPLLIWALYCWRVYTDLNRASLQKSLFALLLICA